MARACCRVDVVVTLSGHIATSSSRGGRGGGRGGGERGACRHCRRDEEEGEGALSVVFVVVACEGGRARRVRMRRERGAVVAALSLSMGEDETWARRCRVVVVACEGGRERSGWARTRDRLGALLACEGE